MTPSMWVGSTTKMKNLKKFVRHAKKITVKGNVSFHPENARLPYSRYVWYKNRKDVTRIEFLDSYFMVTLWQPEKDDTPLLLNIDGKLLRVVDRPDDECSDFIDENTGELHLTMNVGYAEYSSEWVREKYQWKK